jgi:hypothetical protein
MDFDTASGSGILSGPIDGKARLAQAYPSVEAKLGVKVLHRASGFRGVVSGMEKDGVRIKSSTTGLERIFVLTPGAFAMNGETVTLTRPTAAATTKSGPAQTASGSVAVAGQKARVAKASRIWVEGVHDAALVEKVWGDDLRVEGVVVERLDGIDDLAAEVTNFGPTKKQRLGVLVDHLVSGSKETRIVEAVQHPHVLVTGTPYVDVWQAIRPKTLGISAWPQIPKGQDWKTGVSVFLGEPDPRAMWRKLLASVTSWTDLEPDFVGAVEQLIDFVTEPAE